MRIQKFRYASQSPLTYQHYTTGACKSYLKTRNVTTEKHNLSVGKLLNGIGLFVACVLISIHLACT